MLSLSGISASHPARRTQVAAPADPIGHQDSFVDAKLAAAAQHQHTPPLLLEPVGDVAQLPVELLCSHTLDDRISVEFGSHSTGATTVVTRRLCLAWNLCRTRVGCWGGYPACLAIRRMCNLFSFLYFVGRLGHCSSPQKSNGVHEPLLQLVIFGVDKHVAFLDDSNSRSSHHARDEVG